MASGLAPAGKRVRDEGDDQGDQGGGESITRSDLDNLVNTFKTSSRRHHREPRELARQEDGGLDQGLRWLRAEATGRT